MHFHLMFMPSFLTYFVFLFTSSRKLERIDTTGVCMQKLNKWWEIYFVSPLKHVLKVTHHHLPTLTITILESMSHPQKTFGGYGGCATTGCVLTQALDIVWEGHVLMQPSELPEIVQKEGMISWSFLMWGEGREHSSPSCFKNECLVWFWAARSLWTEQLDPHEQKENTAEC